MYFIILPASKNIFMWSDSWACAHITRPHISSAHDGQGGRSVSTGVHWGQLRSATLTKRIEALGSCLLVSRGRDPHGQRQGSRRKVRVTVYLKHKSWSFISKTLQSLRSLVSLEKSLNFLQLWIQWPGKCFLILFGCPRQNINQSSENFT